MTNAMIILMESVKLMEDGIIGTTGRYVEIEQADGTTRKLMEPEPIHTYKTWKALGYQVKRGEKNIAQITIWQKGKGKQQPEESDEEQPRQATGRMFRKTAYFFKASQCEAIRA